MPQVPSDARRLPPDVGYPVALLALTALVLRPLLRGETFLGGDMMQFNLPQFRLIAEVWRSGTLPAWAPELGLGRSLLSDLSLGLYYPGNAVVWFGSPLQALNAFVALHYGWWALGTYALARRLRLSPCGAFVAATVQCAGGLALSTLGNPTLLAGLAWLPWCALAFTVAVQRRAWAPGLLAAFPFALTCLSGAPVDYTLAAGVAALGCAIAGGASPRRAGAQLVATALVAVGLAAVALFPLLAALDELSRGAGLRLADATHWSLHPLEGLGALLPQAFWPQGEGLPAAWIGLAAGQRPWFVSLYTGLLPPCLVALSVRRGGGRREAALWALVGIATAYALGRYTPVFRLVWEVFPPVRALRYPAKHFTPAALALSLLAGVGWDRWRRLEGRRARVLLAPLGLAAGLAVVMALVALSLERPGLVSRAAAPLLVAGAAAAIALLGLPRRWVALLIAADLLLAAPYSTWTAPNLLLAEPGELVARVLQEQRGRPGPARVATSRECESIRLRLPGVELGPAAAQALTRREILLPNSASAAGVRTTWAVSGVDPYRRLRYEATRPNSGLDELEQLRRLSAQLVVHTAASDDPARLERLDRSGPWQLSRLKRALPWAALYTQVIFEPDADRALVRALSVEHDPGQVCVVEADAPRYAGGAPDPAAVKRVEVGQDLLRLHVEAAEPGVVVIREAWAPGWRAELDGEPVPVWPADVLFRGVAVPAGSHELVLRYRASGWAAGLTTSLLALGCVLLGAGFAATRNENTPE